MHVLQLDQYLNFLNSKFDDVRLTFGTEFGIRHWPTTAPPTLVCILPITVSVNKHQNYATFNNNPYITASRIHQAALIVHVSVKVLLGLGSDVGIIIEGSMFVH